MTTPRAAPPIELLPLPLVARLFDHLPAAPFFVKDASLRYVTANAAMLRLCGVRKLDQLVGRTARDFFTEPLARRYEALDRQVLRSGQPIKDRLDLTLRGGARPEWLLFCRLPLLVEGRAIGIAAISQNLPSPDRRHPTYERLAWVADHLQANLSSPLNLTRLAKRSRISASQLERDFISVFGLSPQRFLAKLRIDRALELLGGETSVASVAHACGFADQSAFSRRFREAVGMAPRDYRSRVRGENLAHP